MEIHASCKYDKATVAQIVRSRFFSGGDRQKKLLWYMTLYCIVAVMCTAGAVTFSMNIPLFICAAACIIMMAVLLILYYAVPAVSYFGLGEGKDKECEYVFTDGGIICGGDTTDYKSLMKVVETSVMFYIYKTKKDVIPIDKSLLCDEERGSLRRVLSDAVGDGYKICIK